MTPHQRRVRANRLVPEMQFRSHVQVLPPAPRIGPENTLHVSAAGPSYKVVGPLGTLREVEREAARAQEFLRRGCPTWNNGSDR